MNTQDILEGVRNWINTNNGAYDISAKTGNTYLSLSDALANVPNELRRGGMSIKFIQLTPATYTVVTTEGIVEQPTGTEIQSDPGVNSGTYSANELSAFSSLPATLNSSLTYYLTVTETVDEQEVTTYTTWSITMVQSSDNKYVQYRFMLSTFTGAQFTNVVNWQGVDDEPTAGSNNLVKSGGVESQISELKFDVENHAAQINGGTLKNKELDINNYVFNTGEDAQTEVLIPLNIPVGKNGTQYVVYVQGNTKISGTGKFNVCVKQGTSNATSVDTSLIGKELYEEQKIILTVNNYTSGVDGNLRILYYHAGVNIDIHVTVYKLSFEDVLPLDLTLKKYNTQNLLNIIRFNARRKIDTSGETVNLEPIYSASTLLECSVIPCQKGDLFIINGTGGANERLWAFSDSTNNIISRAEASVTEYELELTAPNNASYLILNKRANNYDICYAKEVSSFISQIKDWISGNINLDAIKKYHAAVDGNQAPYTWVGGSRSGILVPLEEGETIYIKPVSGLSTSFLFIDELDSIVIGETIDNVGDKQIISSEFSGFVPSNANYCYILYKNSSNITVLDEVIVKKEEDIKIILNEIENEYVAKQTPLGIPNLNQLVFGSQDTISSWWFYPQAVSTDTYRKKVFFGFVDKEGYSGVAELTCDSKVPLIKKNRLKKQYIDTHDSVSVSILDDGRLLAVFPDGHNSGNFINVRVSKEKYSVDEFEEPIRIRNASGVSYSQVHKINGKYYIFFRSYLWSWAYTVSEDLVNWSNPVVFLRSNGEVQRYFLAKPISDEPNKLRFATYSNPTHDDTNIRCGYIDFELNEIYDSTGVKVGDFGGDTPVITDSLTILVQQPASPNKNRLFDLAVTPMNTIMFSYATFDNSSTDGTDSEYFIYNNGVITKICDGGEAIWIPKAQSGVFFANDHRIIVGRSDVSSTGYDYIETYILSENAWVLDNEIYKELKNGKYKNRNGYVLTDKNGRYALWFRGYYKSYGGNNTTNYDFDMDAVVYNISKNEIYW